MFKLVVLLSVAAMAAAKPGAVLAPVAYSAVVPGVNSVSQYSSSVIHGSAPAVYSAPTYYSAPAAVAAPAVYGSHVVSPVALTQAPHSPAVVLDAVNGVPLDTPEVVAARAAHYQAKALSGYHHLRKRSVGVVGPVAYSSVVSPSVSYASPLAYHASPLVSSHAYPVAYSSPAVVSAYSAPVVGPYSAVYPKAYSVHPY